MVPTNGGVRVELRSADEHIVACQQQLSAPPA
jgi:hypothetical protein